MLQEKYQTLIDMAGSLGIEGLNVVEGDGVLHIEGAAANAADKQQLWDEYAKLDPDFRAGDLVLSVTAPEDSDASYTVQSGDTLSKIASNYGTTWQAIFEANKDKLDNPDKIFPGQELSIPQE